MIAQAIAALNLLTEAGIIYICKKILSVKKNDYIKKAVMFFIVSISLAMFGNIVVITVGYGSIGIDGLRESIELIVVICALFGVRYLGKYYEKKGK